MAISVVLVAGSLAVSPIAIAGDDEDDEDDEEGDDDACSPDFTCIPSDDDESCPEGFTCEEECDDGDDCELKECEVNGDDDGICTRPVGPICDVPKDPLNGNLIIFVNAGDPGNDIGFCGIECTVFRGMDGCPFPSSNPFSKILFKGRTDEIGMLSFTIPPEEFPVVTVVCETREVGGKQGHWYWVDVPTTMPPFDFDIDRGTNMCCPL